jgi:hypothetical protein
MKRQRKGEGLKSAHCDIPGFSASVRHLLRSVGRDNQRENPATIRMRKALGMG